MSERVVIGLGLFLVVAITAVGAARKATPVAVRMHGKGECKTCHDTPLQTAPHPTHPKVGCAECHGSNPQALLEGMARSLACTSCHAPMQALANAPELEHARDTFFAGGCGSCHPVDGALRRLMPGPDLREARIKLTREWTYRFLTEPYAWDHGTTPGPHHLRSEDDPAVFTAKARAIVTALCGDRERTMSVPRQPEATVTELRAGKCASCHALDRLGSKVSRVWLESFLRAPRSHAAGALHVDPHWSAPEVQRVADKLLSLRDPMFEPKWPVLDRAVVDATDRLFAEHVPGADAAPLVQLKKEAVLGTRLLRSEGCGGCHALLGASEKQVDLTLTRGTAKAHVAQFTNEPAEALAFVEALRRHAASDAWPKPRLALAEGARLAQETGCASCHTDLHKARRLAAWQQALGKPSHDFGLDEPRMFEVIGFFSRGYRLCSPL